MYSKKSYSEYDFNPLRGLDCPVHQDLYNYRGFKVLSTVLRAYKYRMYPDKHQVSMLVQNFGAKRFIYNYFLAIQQERYNNKEKHLSKFDVNNLITLLKKKEEFSWLYGMDDWALKHASEDLSTSYKNFFEYLKKKKSNPKIKEVGLPQFKSKYNDHQSYRTRNIKVDFENQTVTVPKIKTSIKCKLHREFVGNVKSATISRKAGQYYISILVEEAIALKPSTGIEIGIDLGLKDLVILSNGLKFSKPNKMLEKANQALKVAQRKQARTQKGSKNEKKLKLKVAKCYKRIDDIKHTYQHEIAAFLVKNFDAIYMEDLNVKGLMKNKKLSSQFQTSALSSLVNKIEYKCGFYGKTFHKIGRFVPSSKTCSCCGYMNNDVVLGVDEWICPVCKAHHDRDHNAAKNIKNFGQQDLYDRVISSEVTAEVELKIPMALQKHISKTRVFDESYVKVDVRSKQAAQSSVAM